MKRRQFLSALALLPAASAWSFNNEFEQYKKQQNEEFLELSKEFERYQSDYLHEFTQYEQQVSKFWRKPEYSNEITWVQYAQDYQSKTAVDFELGELRLSYLNHYDADKATLQALIKKDIEALLKETYRGSTLRDPVVRNIDKLGPRNIKNKNSQPILDEITAHYGSVEQAAERLAQASLALKHEEQNQKVVEVKIPLPRDLPNKRAGKFQSSIIKFATKWQIDPALIMAIMHTESHFNPMARSHIPAFGLMQIVPASAGRDASKAIYGEQKLFTASELYDPEINIEVGTAYLHVLQNRYLKKVKDPQSRLYCAIAAYNTGTGNVAKAFTGNSSSMSRASVLINNFSSDQVYQFLLKGLPYSETRNYLQKVTKKLDGYRNLINKTA